MTILTNEQLEVLAAFANSLLSAPMVSGDEPITGLPSATTPLAGTEPTVLVQGGVTVQTPSNSIIRSVLNGVFAQISGSTSASGNLHIQSTENATKGVTTIGANGLYVDETLTNNSVSIGIQVSTFAGTHMMMSAVRDGTNYDGNILQTYHASNASAPSTLYAKSRGTYASPTIVQSNDGLGVMVFLGYDGTNYRQAAQIWGIAGNTITPGSVVSGRLEFDTADTSGNMQTVMNLDASKNTNIFGPFRPNNNAGTSGYVLTSQGSSTYPDWAAGVNAINSASTVVNVSAATAPSTGQVLTATSSTAATWQDPSSGGITFTEVTGTSQTCAVNSGYIANNAGLVTFTLPTTAAVGDIIAIVGKGAGGWAIDYGTGQQIQFDGVATSVTSGVMESNNQYDCVELICITADTLFSVRSAVSSGLILT